MRKDWFNIKTFVVMALLVCTATAVCAQKHTLEIKGGVIATSTRNTGCKNKGILDFQPGLVAGGSFSWNFMDAALRAVAEGYYALQGEKYTMDDNKTKFESDISYFKMVPNVRYYAPYVPVYVGTGLYTSFATERQVYSGDKVSESHGNKEYYKVMDFGTRLAFGGELGLGEFKWLAEISYEYGLANISNRKERKIKNQALCISLGVSFHVAGRQYRHF